jgi:hypothetical protein
MISPVSSATHSLPAAQSVTAPQQPAQSKPQPAPTDTVQISAAAQALKEAIENPAQTAREAAGGDLQAKRLLAREAADRAL